MQSRIVKTWRTSGSVINSIFPLSLSLFIPLGVLTAFARDCSQFISSFLLSNSLSSCAIQNGAPEAAKAEQLKMESFEWGLQAFFVWQAAPKVSNDR